MPELTISRTHTTPAPMVCMYCGAAATTKREWRVENRPAGRPSAGGGGGDLSAAPTGDDPISTVIAVLMLPLVLWELLKSLVAATGAVVGYFTRPRTPPTPPAPARELPTTLVFVTTCARHRRFRDRFVWAGMATGIVLVALWVWGVLETRRVMGTENVGLAVVLLFAAIFASVLLPLALSAWYAFGGPVVADRVTEDAVVMDRVRQAYFDATGGSTADPV